MNGISEEDNERINNALPLVPTKGLTAPPADM